MGSPNNLPRGDHRFTPDSTVGAWVMKRDSAVLSDAPTAAIEAI